MMRFQTLAVPLLFAALALTLGWSIWLLRRHTGEARLDLPDGLLIGLVVVAALGLSVFLIDVLSIIH